MSVQPEPRNDPFMLAVAIVVAAATLLAGTAFVAYLDPSVAAYLAQFLGAH